MVRFTLNGQPQTVADEPNTRTLLQWLRKSGHIGTKEGCAEGDCGACTVVVLDHDGYRRAINSCLVLLPMIGSTEVWTAEGIGTAQQPHPVQQAMVDTLGSQCGYCTPGFVMTLFEAWHRGDLDEDWKLDDQLAGNLCRCTGYLPIKEAARTIAGTGAESPTSRTLEGVDHEGEGTRFIAPTSLAALLQLVGENPEARIVCGATDLGLDVTKQHQQFPVLISTDRVADLHRISATPDGWQIGASVRLSALEAWSSRALPVLHRMLRYFGARQIKNRASIGGNLCNASPIGDIAPVLLALDAEVELASAAGVRTLPVADFFLGYRHTALQPGEVLTQIHVPRPSPETRLGAYKVSRRRELDISAVSAAMAVDVQGGSVHRIRIAYGGMAATSKRALATEDALNGLAWTEANVRLAAKSLQQDFAPMSDHRGSAWYRQTVARNLLVGFWHETRDQAAPSLPPHHSGTVVEAP